MVPLSLGFVIGPAGSGKTRYIADRIIEGLCIDGPAANRPATILLVPDQATFQMERLILQDPRVLGFMGLHVHSFRRLCMRVLEETGHLGLPFITAVGKSMAIQSILWEHRKDLTVFAPMVNYPGFRETLGRTLSEMTAYGVSPSTLVGISEDRTVPFLQGKVRDLEVVFDRYREFLQGRFLDPDDYLHLAAERMPSSSILRGATVYIDGFSGFTPAQYGALLEIMKAASGVTVALCADRAEMGRAINEASLFHPTREVHDKLVSLSRQVAVRIDETVYLPSRLPSGDEAPMPRFRASRDLAHLESRFRTGRGGGAERDGSVRLISATNPLAELEFVAREILRLVRDCGMRFKDITVEARDLTEYAQMLPLVFRDHGIPFFFDQKRSLSHHPLFELIRAALDVVLSNWSLDSVMRYLKTDLVPVERFEVDLLENYALSHGIVGERWISAEDWRYSRKYMAREDEAAELSEEAAVVDGIRRKATEALGKFYAALKPYRSGAVTASVVSMALGGLLDELRVDEQVATWTRLAEQAGDLSEAADHRGIQGRVDEILKQAAEVLRDQPADLKSYSLLIAAGLEDVRLGAIPPSLDQVLVGSMDRSRQPDCKATFLIGALAGVFPKRQSEDGVFTDAEREFIANQGIDLEPSSNLRQFHEQYLAYIALTRPSQALYISYPLGDQEGKALAPSHVVDLVEEALPGLVQETASVDPPGTEADLQFVLPARADGIALRRLSLLRDGRAPGTVWTEVYRHMLSPERRGATRKILSSLPFSNAIAPLEGSLVRSLYGHSLHTSVSRLETFAACPFRHFARDGLSLKEREHYKLEPADAGVFMHAALRRYVEEIQGSGRDWGGITREEALKTMDSVVESLTPTMAGELFLSSARYRYMSSALRRILRRAGGAVLAQVGAGQFRPVAAEVLFGFPGGPKPLRVTLPGKEEVLLRGQIDRIDAAVGPDGTLLRIVDYKSSPRKLDLLDVRSGLALQLLVYLLVATEAWEDMSAKPAGALYFSMIDPFIQKSVPVAPDEAEAIVRRKLRMSGLVLRDREVARLMDNAAAGYSDIIPVQFVTGGDLSLRSSAAAPEDFDSLLCFVRDKVGEMSSRIFSGRVDIEPYRKGQSRACQYCPYGPLCTFDVLLPGNRYNIIRSMPSDGLWEEFRKHGRGGGES